MEQIRTRLFRFGAFELDARAGELRKHGVKLRLQEQPFRILLMLLENSGEVVLREEIRKRLWPNDTIVEFDHSINAAIRRLRDALGESADDPRFVETVERRGYRFLGHVEVVAAAGPAILDTTPLDSSDLVGKTLSHYRVLEKIGAGGMGEVYRARDMSLDRVVALKVLPADKVADPERKRRFVREAKAASALNHPNIITIHEFAEEHGTQFIVMEFVDGKPLDQLIPQSGLRTAETLTYAVQIADALAKAHAAGIVHRDLKPANIMVAHESHVKVLDFGVAKLTEASTGAEDATLTVKDRTEAGAIVGTISYMSPEQAEGKPVDTRSDIFSFGAVLYEMLTGQKAFQGDSRASTLAALLTQEPKPLSQSRADVPEEFEKLIARCLRKDRERRLQNAADLKVALLDLKEESESARTKARRPARRRWTWTAVATGMAALAAVGWLVIARSDQTPFVVKTITGYPGETSSPTFSPDGSQVAFAWTGEKQDNDDIYVKLADSGALLRLTTNPADDDRPAWSPDGRWIAFLRGADPVKELLMISPLGGVERKLADLHPPVNAFYWWCPPAWTPDSKFVAARDDTAIVLVSVEGGEKRKLTSPPAGWAGDYYPAISPDGRTLAFARIRNAPTSDIFLAPMSDGARARQLTHDNREVFGLAWTPDGTEIVFSSNRGGDQTLWRIRTSGGTPERLPVVGPDAVHPAIARQGRRAAFVRDSGESSVWRLDLSTEGRRRLPVRVMARGGGSPMISPDGNHIAFTSDLSGAAEVWVCDHQGANAVQLTSIGFARDPYWSPDSQNIVFEGRPADRSLIFVIPAAGGRPRPLSTEEGYRPSWSRDGRWIYFYTRHAGTVQTWKVRAEGGHAIQLTKGRGGPGIESVDGKYFYYQKIPGGELWKVPVEGGDETLVTTVDLNLMNFWALGAEGLYFSEPREKDHRTILKLLHLETGEISPIAVLDQPFPDGSMRLSLSSDGRWLLYDQADRKESDIMLIENFH